MIQPKNHIKLAVSLLSIVLASGAFAQPRLVQEVSGKGKEISIPFRKYVLPNGLTVLLTEDHSDPIVHVDVTYHVGSAREEIGKSGFAHFFEHMMFEGSDHVKSGDHFKIVTAAGGSMNGTTNTDKTHYFETVPANQLEKMLWLESDRMGFLMDAVTQPKFEIQRATVKNERGQNYDNRPYGLASEATSKALYPYGHPYSWLTIGYIRDLNQVDVGDLKRFFLRWYGPNNATLTIGGDIDVPQTLAWVEKYFGSIPRGPEVEKTVLPAPVLSGDRYVSYTDNYARLPLLYISYPGVKLYDKDEPALDALAMIIGQGKNSLLYQGFVKSRQAVQVSMSSGNEELAGTIGIQVVPYPGHSLADVQRKVDSILTAFGQRGVTEEDLARFKGSAEAYFVNSLASISGKVDELAGAQTFAGNPDRIGKDLEEIRKVTRADVMRVYEKYIKGRPAVILSVLPKNSQMAPAAPDNYTVDSSHYNAPDYGYAGLVYHKAADNFDRSIQPPAGPNPVVKVPVFWTDRKANGIKMIGAYTQEIPSVSIDVEVKGGGLWASVDTGKAGLAGIVGEMLGDATEHYSAEAFSAALEKLGSQIRVSAGPGQISFNVSSLTRNLDATLALLQERLFHPKFTQEALDRIRQQTMQGFQQRRTQPATVASSVFNRILYAPGNVRTYGLSGNEKTIGAITLADVQAFYDNYFAPNLTSLEVVGDVPEAVIKSKLAFLDTWQQKDLTVPAADTATRPVQERTIYLVDVPHAAQSEIRIGYVTNINYDATGLYYRLGLMNYTLGGGFNSRINLDLREAKGWTYGAHSGFVSGQYGGTFAVSTGVRASATDSAVMQSIQDIREYAGNGITPAELTFMQNSIGQNDALKYETNDQKAGFLFNMQWYGLKPDYVEQQGRILSSVTKAELDDLAKKYLDTDHMAILVVGDKQKVLPGLSATGYHIIELDTDGLPK